MTRRTIGGVLRALDALANAGEPRFAVEATLEATLCAAEADGVLVTSLISGTPVAAWTWPGDFFPRPRQETLEAITATHPYPLITHTRGGPGWALRLSDILSGREYRATAVYVDLLKELSIPYQLAFSVPTVASRSLCLALARTSHDFTDTECDQINALRGPLGIAARRGPSTVISPSCHGPIDSLSPRELEILHLASTGLSDTQIGRRLGITQRTVGKHLENVYRKTRTGNRTEAAAHLSGQVLQRTPSDAFASGLQLQGAGS
jgi:DNA-binding CsgD family transcriptional regulator